MRILITGSSGLVGSALVPLLQSQGNEICRLVRRKADASKNEAYWNPTGGSVDKSALSSLRPEAVVHLAGESIMGRWTKEKKRKIHDSRVNGTKALATALTYLESPPKVLICASAVGYYGSRDEETLTEASFPGSGFLSEVCQEWEHATAPAEEKGIRVVKLRFGIVLSSQGGALKKMLFPFKLGLGGILGNGQQYFSWVALDDLVSVIDFVIKQSKLQGVFNLTAPYPVTNREFTKTLGKTLHRPTLFPIPASTARLVFGEMADEMLLSSTKAIPKRLLQEGYVFKYPELKGALEHLLK